MDDSDSSHSCGHSYSYRKNSYNACFGREKNAAVFVWTGRDSKTLCNKCDNISIAQLMIAKRHNPAFPQAPGCVFLRFSGEAAAQGRGGRSIPEKRKKQ